MNQQQVVTLLAALEVHKVAVQKLAAEIRNRPGGDELLRAWAARSQTLIERTSVPGNYDPAMKDLGASEFSEQWAVMLKSIGL